VTQRNLRVLGVDKDENLLVVEGSVPGPARRIHRNHQSQEAAQRAPRICGFGDGRSVEGGEARGEEGISSASRGRVRGIGTELTHMATIDIHNLSGAKVGTLDLADEIFGAVNEDLLWEAVKHYRAGQRPARMRPRPAGRFPVRARSCGSRRARGGRVLARSVRLCGGTAARCTVRSPRSYDYAFPRKKLLGALRSALAAKFADGKLIVVNAFDVKEPKTKEFRKRSIR
jgi:hypothetical protein